MSSGPVKPIKNPITYPGRIIWIGGVPYPDPGGERKSGQQTRHRPKGRALDYSQLPARAPEANSANAEAGKIVA